MTGLRGLNDGAVLVEGGECPDMVAGRCTRPRDASLPVRDGTPCGFPAPTRAYRGPEPNPAEG